MFAARSIDAGHESMRHWAEKFGWQFSVSIRRRTPLRGDKWRPDEIAATICGNKRWLRRAVDQNGFVLDILV